MSCCIHFISNIMATIAKMKMRPLYEVDDLATVLQGSMSDFMVSSQKFLAWQMLTSTLREFWLWQSFSTYCWLQRSPPTTRFLNGIQTACGALQLYNPETVAWGRDGNCHWICNISTSPRKYDQIASTLEVNSKLSFRRQFLFLRIWNLIQPHSLMKPVYILYDLVALWLSSIFNFKLSLHTIHTIQVTLDKIRDISDGKRISAKVKVQKLGETSEVKQGLHKQDATIADKTACMRLTLASKCWKVAAGQVLSPPQPGGSVVQLHQVFKHYQGWTMWWSVNQTPAFWQMKSLMLKLLECWMLASVACASSAVAPWSRWRQQ